MDFGSFYKNPNEIKNENTDPINNPSTENSEIGDNEYNRKRLSQSMNEGNKNLFNMNQIILETFRKDSSDFYDYPEEHVAEQKMSEDNDCPVISASKCCKEEIQLPNQEENVSKLETDQENKNALQSKEFSNFQQPQKNELEFNKNENPNEFENQTFIDKENNLMYIEEHSYNLPSPMNMNSNNADLNSSNINNIAVEEDEKSKRKIDQWLTTLRRPKDSLNDDIVQPLIKKILREILPKDFEKDIFMPGFGREPRHVLEELAIYCNKTIYEIYKEAKKTNSYQETIKENQNNISELYEDCKINKDNLYCKTFIQLMDLRFIDMIKIYYDKRQIDNILNIYSDSSYLKKILANFADLEKDFGNERNGEFDNRKKALKDFIDFAENIRKQKKIRFITS